MDEKRTMFEEMEDKYDKVLNLLELYNLGRFGYRYIIFLLSNFPKRESFCLNRLELAKLIQFFESCYGNKNCDISLNGIVNTPREGEVKGSNLKCSITDNRMLLNLLEYLHTLLYNEQDGLYNYIFDWDEKEKIKYIHGLGPEYQYTEDSFFKEPYSDHELNKIISYEEYSRKKTELKPNLLIGQRLTFMNKKFIDKGMFTNNKGEITKEYSLLYDYLVINGQVNKIGENDCPQSSPVNFLKEHIG